MNNLEGHWTFVLCLPSNRFRKTRVDELLSPRRDLCTEERPRATRELDLANLVNFNICGENYVQVLISFKTVECASCRESWTDSGLKLVAFRDFTRNTMKVLLKIEGS